MINERISVWDLLFKYTIRDSIIGFIGIFPASIGVFLRMAILPLFMGRCGKGLTIKPFVTIKFPENLKIGNHVGIGEYSWIDANGGIEIGDYTRIGPQVVIASLYHDYNDPDTPVKKQKKVLKKVTIGKDVTIASGVIIQSGITIGDKAVIGPGTIIAKDVPENGIFMANPGRLVGYRGGIYKKHTDN